MEYESVQYVTLCMHACLVTQSFATLCDPMDWSLPGSSVHEILQERILEWAAISPSKGSSQPRNWTHNSCIFCTAGRILYTEPPGKPCLVHTRFLIKLKCLEDRFRSWFYLCLQVGQVAHTVQGTGTRGGKTHDKCNHIFLCLLPSSLTAYIIRFLCTKEDKSARGKMTTIKC